MTPERSPARRAIALNGAGGAGGVVGVSDLRSTARDGVRSAVSRLAPREASSFFFALLLLYLFFEYGRPAQPLKIPMLISILSFGGWLVRRDKRWSALTSGFIAFLALMAVGIPMAANNYWAFWETFGMAVLLLCICAPLPSVVTSVRRIRIWIYAFVSVMVYVAGWAIFHEGFGPAGSSGAQDENYVGAMMGMAIPFAYFSIFAERRRLGKALLALAILVFCGAMLAADDPSRGGFVGLCAVVLYCLAKSPRKWIAVGIALLIALVVLGFASARYWNEITTINEIHVGTADERLELWAIGLRMFVANPVFGVGPGNFRWVIGDYQSAEQHAKFGRSLAGSKVLHSLFMELLAEMGLAGALVLAALLWRTRGDLGQIARIGSGRGARLTADDDRRRLDCYAHAVTGSILACLVNGLFLSLLFFSYLWILLALAAAIAQVFRAELAHDLRSGVAGS